MLVCYSPGVYEELKLRVGGLGEKCVSEAEQLDQWVEKNCVGREWEGLERQIWGDRSRAGREKV